MPDSRPLSNEPDWRCECGDLNRWYEAGCFRCGAGRPEEPAKRAAEPDDALPWLGGYDAEEAA